jgi:hypothetical protein
MRISPEVHVGWFRLDLAEQLYRLRLHLMRVLIYRYRLHVDYKPGQNSTAAVFKPTRLNIGVSKVVGPTPNFDM